MLSMERKIYKRLLEWKNNPRRKPLILNGARQVGKTWLLKHFGEKAHFLQKESKRSVYKTQKDIPKLIQETKKAPEGAYLLEEKKNNLAIPTFAVSQLSSAPSA